MRPSPDPAATPRLTTATINMSAEKVVAAKLALAARCDFINVNTGRPRSAVAGQQFRTEIETKLAKWKEPDKAPTLKALPKCVSINIVIVL